MGGWGHLTILVALCGERWLGVADVSTVSNREGRETPIIFSDALGALQEMLQAPTPHSDAAGQDALNGASIERAHGVRGSCSSQFPQRDESLLGFFGQRCDVDIPEQDLGDLYTQELGAAPHLTPVVALIFVVVGETYHSRLRARYRGWS